MNAYISLQHARIPQIKETKNLYNLPSDFEHIRSLEDECFYGELILNYLIHVTPGMKIFSHYKLF